MFVCIRKKHGWQTEGSFFYPLFTTRRMMLNSKGNVIVAFYKYQKNSYKDDRAELLSRSLGSIKRDICQKLWLWRFVLNIRNFCMRRVGQQQERFPTGLCILHRGRFGSCILRLDWAIPQLPADQHVCEERVL